MLANCDIVIFPIYGQFGAMRKLDSGCMVGRTYIFIKSKSIFFIKSILQKLKTELKSF